MEAETRYTKSGDAYIAYQVLGDGGPDLLYLSSGTISIGSIDDEPGFARFHGDLASFARLIRMDLRGVGLSDPIDPSTPPSLEQWVGDALAVLDAAGSERAALCGADDGALVAMLTAATHPDRTAALILLNAYARLLRDVDYPQGLPDHLVERFTETVYDDDNTGSFADLEVFVPAVASDPRFRQWWQRAGNRGASPATAQALARTRVRSDLRSVLPAIQAPTLVIHRKGNRAALVGHGRYLAEHIGGARYVELPGDEHLPYVGDSDAIVAEIEEFLTGMRHVDVDRVLATILFCDIVRSTDLVSELGDRRWRDLLDAYYAVIRRQLARFAGREVKAMGDGILATFGGPARAIRCALAIRDGARQLGLDVRVGLHTGEVETIGDDIGGVAVHIGERVSARAAPGEVLASRTVVDLVAGSGIRFEDRGEHELKGVPDRWQLFAVTP
ncbi:MAG TPA: adenylate/guanylate cyclase domain-containing protein [Acidimicrobiia bacterium]|nr:adenylate/guanylate cyclase domain-containing protein [Acidimicrobiia bacterium]